MTHSGLPKLGITLFSLTLEMPGLDYSLETMIRRGLSSISGRASRSSVPELPIWPQVMTTSFRTQRSPGRVRRANRDEHEPQPRAAARQADDGGGGALDTSRPRWRPRRRLGFLIGKSAILSTRPFVKAADRRTTRHEFGVEVHSPESVDHPSCPEPRELFDAVGSPTAWVRPDFTRRWPTSPPPGRRLIMRGRCPGS